MSLRQFRLVYTRELAALLNNPLFYVLTGIFFLLTSLLYLVMLAEFARGSDEATVNVTDSVIRPTFHMVHYFLLIQVPLLTMRVFAEEQSNGMLDLLQTTPLDDWPLLVGKWAAGTTAVGSYVVLTSLYPFATSLLGDVEWAVAAGSILALVLGSAAYVAIGTFFSAITESQVTAAVLSYVTLFFLVFMHLFGTTTQVPMLADASRHFAVTEHIEGLLSGNVAPMNVAYFVAVTVVFLFMTARLLEGRRWRA